MTRLFRLRALVFSSPWTFGWSLGGALSLTLSLGACGGADPDGEDEGDLDSQKESQGKASDDPEESESASSGPQSEDPEPDQSPESGQGEEKSEDPDNSDASQEPEESEESPEPKAEFSDAALKKCVSEAAGSLEAQALAKLSYLECRMLGIKDLSGIGQLSGLEYLSLFENAIEDLEPLRHLQELKGLQLGNNQIRSIEALSGLPKLTRLSLVVNKISDVAALQSLSALKELNLDHNEIEDIAALSKLESLEWLTLDNNKISDKAAIKSLKSKIPLVYADLQNRGGWGHFAPMPSLAPASRQALRGELRLRKLEQGGYDFDYLLPDGRLMETSKEWWGSLERRGDRLELLQDGRRVSLGRVNTAGQLSLCRGEWEKNCSLMVGVKYPGAEQVGPASVSVNLELSSAREQSPERFMVSDPFAKHESLLPFVFSAPNQYDAGSCAYMAATGSMEILLNQKDKISKLDYAGKNNLSEPFLMNIGGGGVPYFHTDAVYTFNVNGGALPDSKLPFVLSGKSAQKNWKRQIPSDWKSNATDTPEVERTVLYYDPPRNANSKWNVALLDESMVERIKYVLRMTNAPVLVVYNHNGYWHVSIVVGYDDSHAHGECPMVHAGIKALKKQKKGDLVKRIEAHMKKLGGCSKKGSFFVRDSIYGGTKEDEPYTYGGGKSNGRYSRRIVKREYEWIWYLTNHITSVYRADATNAGQ